MWLAAAVIVRVAVCVAIAETPTEPKLDSADVTHITRLVDASHPGCTIYHLTPLAGGDTVYIATTCEVFKAVKEDGRWHFVPADVIITH
jgi:hypothetical protein